MEALHMYQLDRFESAGSSLAGRLEVGGSAALRELNFQVPAGAEILAEAEAHFMRRPDFCGVHLDVARSQLEVVSRAGLRLAPADRHLPRKQPADEPPHATRLQVEPILKFEYRPLRRLHHNRPRR